MAYADRNVGGSRIVAIVIVALIVAGMGYAFVTGLAYQFIKKKVEDLNAFDVKDPPPPPPEELPPPPPPDKSAPPPPTFIPQVQVQVPQPPTPQVVVQNTVPVEKPIPIVVPSPVPTPKPTPPSHPPKPASPRGDYKNWVTSDDYPGAAMRSGITGTTGFRVDVDASGRATSCTVTSSSGSAILDSTACSLVKRRSKFNPATDSNGNAVPGSWSLRFRWEIPKD